MASLRKAVRYPRLVIIAAYVGLVLGSIALGMELAESPAWTQLLPTISMILIGIFVLHSTYTNKQRMG